MSDTTPRPNTTAPGPDEPSPLDVVTPFLRPGRDNVVLIYILYLAGMVPAFGVVPILIGFVMALTNRNAVGAPWASHYEFQYRQAVAGLAFVIVSAVLIFVLIGFLGFLLTAIWWIVRSVKGLQAASHGQPIADPRSWYW